MNVLAKIPNESVSISSRDRPNGALDLLSLRLLLTVTIGTVVAMLGLLFWGMDRSLNMLDEGFALLCATKPEIYAYCSSFHFFLAKIPNLFGNQICSLRFAHIVTCLLGSVALTAGVQSWIRQHCGFLALSRSLWTVAYLFAIVGSFLAYCVHPQVLTYNGLVTFFLSLSSGCLFYGLSRDEKSLQFRLAFIAVGIALVCAFFCKFSSALVIASMSFIFVLLFQRSRFSGALVNSLIGVVIGFAVFFSFFESPYAWYRIQTGTLSALSGGNHGPAAVFANTVTSFRRHIGECMLSIALVVGTIVGAGSRVLVRFSNRQLLVSVSILSVVTLISFVVFSTWQYGTVHRSILYLGMLPLLVLVAAKKWNDGSASNQLINFLLVELFLLALPFAISLGTDTPILWHALTSFASVYLAFALCYFAIGIFYDNVIFPCLFLSAIGLIALNQFVRGFVFELPHMHSLIEQTSVIQSGPISGMHLEPALKMYIDKSKRLLADCGYQEGDSILALNDGPGLVYALGGVSPSAAWYFEDAGAVKINDYQLSLLQPPSDRYFVIITNTEGNKLPPKPVLARLESRGVNLSTDFKLIGTITRPYLYGTRGQKSYVYARISKVTKRSVQTTDVRVHSDR